MQKPTKIIIMSLLAALLVLSGGVAASSAQEQTPTPTPTPEDDGVTVVVQDAPTSSSSSSTSTPTSGASSSSSSTSASGNASLDGTHNAMDLDNQTRIIAASYDEDTGTATVVIESEKPQYVVLTDAGGVWEGGRISQVSQVVNGRATLRIPVTEVDNAVAVTVAVESGLYGIPIEGAPGSDILPDERSDGVALLVGLTLPPIGTVLVGRVRDRKKRESVEVVGRTGESKRGRL